MIKEEFLEAIRPELKKRGYRKNGMYWYRRCEGFTCCVNLQTSNWDSNNYYVNVGLSLEDAPDCRPTLLKWYCRHRCTGHTCAENILPEEFLPYLDSTFGRLHSKTQIREFLVSQKAREMPGQNQFWY